MEFSNYVFIPLGARKNTRKNMKHNWCLNWSEQHFGNIDACNLFS